MSRKKKLKTKLFQKNKLSFLLLFLFTFLTSYLSFLIHFNFRANLSLSYNTRGKFYYLFGEYPVIKEIKNGRICVNWSKLLLILFLLYFPIKIIIQFTLNYFQKRYEREVEVYLSKNLLVFAHSNKNLLVKKFSQKIYVLDETIPNFSQQFFSVPLILFGIITDISLEVFSLYFLIKTRNLTDLVPLIIVFVLINLAWFAFFNYFVAKIKITNNKKIIDYQQNEKIQIRNFLENLNTANNKTEDLEKLFNLLNNNSQKISFLNLVALFFSLPDLIISVLSILFLFSYYQFYLGKEDDLSWNDYFIANSLQRIFSKLKKGFNLLPTISSLKKNYRKIEESFLLNY